MTDNAAAQELLRIQKAWESEFPNEDHTAIPMITRLGIFSGYYRLAYERLLKPFGLRNTDYHVLGTLRSYGAKTPSSPTALSRFSFQNNAGTTRTLDRLESAGLIERRPHSVDRRRVDITLTKRGAELAEKSYRADLDFAQQLFANFSQSEQDQLIKLVDDLIDNLTGFIKTTNSTKKQH